VGRKPDAFSLPLAPANLRQVTTCKGDTLTRPSADGTADSVTTVPTLPRSLPAAFAAGAGVGVLGGLIGLGGAEFRLPLLIGVFGFLALQAVIMNKAMSLIVVLTRQAGRWAHRHPHALLVRGRKPPRRQPDRLPRRPLGTDRRSPGMEPLRPPRPAYHLARSPRHHRRPRRRRHRSRRAICQRVPDREEHRRFISR
jgi:hypothetical protein